MRITDILPILLYIPCGFDIAECCQDLNEGKCCFNFYENESGICEECPFGTFGENCEGRCPSGYFGRLCQERCSCKAEECDNVNGCPPLTDWSTSFSSETTEITPTSSTRQQPITSATWKSTALVMIGSIGTCVIAGIVYHIKFRYFKRRVHVSSSGRINDTESSAEVENNVNERQQLETARQSDRECALLQEKWTDYNNECCMSGNSNIYCDLNQEFYDSSICFVEDGSTSDDDKVGQEGLVIQTGNTDSACSRYGVTFNRERSQCPVNHDGIKNETADPLSSVPTRSERNMGVLISERFSNSNLRPYSSIKYNRYKLNTGNDQESSPYQALLFCKTEDKETDVLLEEPYQDTIPNARDKGHMDTHEALDVSESKRNTRYSRRDSKEKLRSRIASHNLASSNGNAYCLGYRESVAEEWPFHRDLTRFSTHIEKEESEACETAASGTASGDECNPNKENVMKVYHNGTSLIHHASDKERIQSVSNIKQSCARREHPGNHRPYSRLQFGTTTDDNDRSSNENNVNCYEDLSIYEDIRNSDHKYKDIV